MTKYDIKLARVGLGQVKSLRGGGKLKVDFEVQKTWAGHSMLSRFGNIHDRAKRFLILISNKKVK